MDWLYQQARGGDGPSKKTVVIAIVGLLIFVAIVITVVIILHYTKYEGLKRRRNEKFFTHWEYRPTAGNKLYYNIDPLLNPSPKWAEEAGVNCSGDYEGENYPNVAMMPTKDMDGYERAKKDLSNSKYSSEVLKTIWQNSPFGGYNHMDLDNPDFVCSN